MKDGNRTWAQILADEPRSRQKLSTIAEENHITEEKTIAENEREEVASNCSLVPVLGPKDEVEQKYKGIEDIDIGWIEVNKDKENKEDNTIITSYGDDEEDYFDKYCSASNDAEGKEPDQDQYPDPDLDPSDFRSIPNSRLPSPQPSESMCTESSFEQNASPALARANALNNLKPGQTLNISSPSSYVNVLNGMTKGGR